MKIHAFITNWKGHYLNALNLESQLQKLCRVDVINSDDSVISKQPHWHSIGEEGYFTHQWNKALSIFEGDILFQIQADSKLEKMKEMLDACEEAFAKKNSGVYAPNLDYTHWTYQLTKLKKVEEGLYEVPQTDSVFWAVSREVLEKLPPFDAEKNSYGHGVDFITIATARRLGKLTFRDYRFLVQHPRSRGYNSEVASRQMESLFHTLSPELLGVVKELWVSAHQLR